MEFLGHMIVLFSVFLRNLHIIFPQQLYRFTLLPTVYKGSLFSTSLPMFVIFVLLDDRNPKRYEVISHCDFDLHFLDG